MAISLIVNLSFLNASLISSDGQISNQILVPNHKSWTKRCKSLCQISNHVLKWQIILVQISYQIVSTRSQGLSCGGF